MNGHCVTPAWKGRARREAKRRTAPPYGIAGITAGGGSLATTLLRAQRGSVGFSVGHLGSEKYDCTQTS